MPHPELTITPSRSSAINAVSAVRPGSAKFDVLARRAAFAPKMTAFGAKRHQTRLEAVAQRGGMADFAHGDFRGGPKAGDAREIFGTRTPASLLAAAEDLRRKRRIRRAKSRRRCLADRPACGRRSVT